MFCGCPTEFGAEPNTQVCPICLGLPGAMPVVNAQGGRVGDPDRPRAELRDRRVVPVRAEELLLPGHAEELPDLAVRRADRLRRLDGRRASTARPYRVEIERAHMEEDTGKSLHVGGATGRIHGADYSLVDYNRAGIPLIEIVTKPIIGTGEKAPAGRPGVRRAAARAAARPRRLRRPDGAGLAALRREPVAGARRAPARSAPAPRPRTSTRCARSSGRSATRSAATPRSSPPAARSCRRPGTGTRTPASPRQRPGEVRRRGLPLLPRARPGAGRAVARVGRGAARRRCPSRRASGGPGCRPSGASPTSRCATPSAPARSAWSRRPSPPAPRPQAARKWWLWRAGPPRQRARASSSPTLRRHARPTSPGCRRWSTRARSTTSWPARCFDGVLAGEGTPDEVVAARGLAVVSDEGALSRRRRPRDRGQPRRRRQDPRRQGRRRRRADRRGDEGDARPGRRRPGPRADPREALPESRDARRVESAQCAGYPADCADSAVRAAQLRTRGLVGCSDNSSRPQQGKPVQVRR